MELFKLFGTIALNGVDEAHSALDGITDKASGVGSKLASGVGTAVQTVGGVAKAVGTAAVGAVAATTTAVATIGKSAIENYADYEQLVGGVETLFNQAGMSWSDYAEKMREEGKLTAENASEIYAEYEKLAKGSEIVQENAAQAYTTAGMSANDYMETVTSFSAKLLQDLGGNTVDAANIADKAIRDMSDNANKMGTDMSSIQNAYQGFAKQNYSMLDNLKLGYGGTQQEMARLLADAQELDSTFDADWSIDSKGHLEAEFSDIIEAIHIVQDNMGITGTTAKEAASTIQGSIASMKASWQNLLTGMAYSDSDIGQLISNFTSSLETVADNLLPVIEETLMGIGAAAVDIAPFLVNFVSELVRDVAPNLLKAGAELADTLLTAFAQSLIDTSPILAPIGEMILGVKDSLADVFDSLKENIDWDSVFSDLQGILEKVCGFITGMADGFAKFVDYATTDGTALNDLFVGIKDSVGGLVEKISDALKNIFGMLGENINWDSLFAGLEEALEVACGLIETIVGGIEDLVEYATTEGTPLNEFFSGIKEAAQDVVDWFKENWGGIAETFDGLKDKIGDACEKVIGAFSGIIDAINDNDGISKTLTWLKESVLDPLAEAFGALVDAGSTVAEIIGNVIAAIIEAASSDETLIGKLVKWIGEDLKIAFDNVKQAAEFLANFLNGDMDAAFENIKKIGENVSEAWKNNFELVKGILEEIIELFQINFQEGVDAMTGVFSTTQLNKEDVTLLGDLKPGETPAGNGIPNFTAGMGGWTPTANKLEQAGPYLAEQAGPQRVGSGSSSGKSNLSTPNKGSKKTVELYASGAVLTKPTAFGLNPYSGKTMVGGEDGAEAIAPIDVLQGYVSEAVEAKTSGMNDTLNRILDALIVMNDNMGANMREAMDGVSLRMNNRELARAVKAVT